MYRKNKKLRLGSGYGGTPLCLITLGTNFILCYDGYLQSVVQELPLLLPRGARVEDDALAVVALPHHPVGPEDPRVRPGVGLLLSQQIPRQLVCSCVPNSFAVFKRVSSPADQRSQINWREIL